MGPLMRVIERNIKICNFIEGSKIFDFELSINKSSKNLKIICWTVRPLKNIYLVALSFYRAAGLCRLTITVHYAVLKVGYGFSGGNFTLPRRLILCNWFMTGFLQSFSS